MDLESNVASSLLVIVFVLKNNNMERVVPKVIKKLLYLADFNFETVAHVSVFYELGQSFQLLQNQRNGFVSTWVASHCACPLLDIDEATPEVFPRFPAICFIFCQSTAISLYEMLATGCLCGSSWKDHTLACAKELAQPLYPHWCSSWNEGAVSSE